jgi:flagellar P-ring protein precursor FlgI
MMRKTAVLIIVLFVASFLRVPEIHAARIKDIVTLEGTRTNQLVGYGLVTGLNGTGDKTGTEFTIQTLVNMLKREGVNVDKDDVNVKNVAAVIVTGEISPFDKPGGKIDVTVSSIGDAKSLEGGTLLMTPLNAANGKIYAVAQGAVSIGGFNVSGGGGGIQKNHPTVGRVPNGASVERGFKTNTFDKDFFVLNLKNPDITTITRVSKAINMKFGNEISKPTNLGSVKINIPYDYKDNKVAMLSLIEEIEIVPDMAARIIIDERTGTVVIGKDVKISTVAISHGNLSVQISAIPEVSQPLPLAGGETVVTVEEQILVTEEAGKLITVKEGITIRDLVRSLNAIGVSPRDMIAVFQAMKTAGALQAELIII